MSDEGKRGGRRGARHSREDGAGDRGSEETARDRGSEENARDRGSDENVRDSGSRVSMRDRGSNEDISEFDAFSSHLVMNRD